MQNLTIFIPILLLFLYTLLLADSRPSEQNRDLDFQRALWSEEFPDGFDARAAAAVACARCGSTPSRLNIPPKLETRNALSLDEKIKEQSRLNAVTEAKPSVEKHKRATFDSIPIAKSSMAEKYAEKLDTVVPAQQACFNAGCCTWTEGGGATSRNAGEMADDAKR
jgi:hypothetical protein